eukprot:2708171-Amphidinium_carterae.1
MAIRRADPREVLASGLSAASGIAPQHYLLQFSADGILRTQRQNATELYENCFEDLFYQSTPKDNTRTPLSVLFYIILNDCCCYMLSLNPR